MVRDNEARLGPGDEVARNSNIGSIREFKVALDPLPGEPNDGGRDVVYGIWGDGFERQKRGKDNVADDKAQEPGGYQGNASDVGQSCSHTTRHGSGPREGVSVCVRLDYRELAMKMGANSVPRYNKM